VKKRLRKRFARDVVEARRTGPASWVVRLACGHATTRQRTETAPRSVRCLACSQGAT